MPWLSAIAMILRHGREHQRTVCNFRIWTIADESRAVAEKSHDAVEKFDTYRNLQRHRAEHGFLVSLDINYRRRRKRHTVQSIATASPWWHQPYV